jgi:hypothetical protein
MRRFFALSLLLSLAVASHAARADQDDIDNNADLLPTPEERARAVVLKRWPDATEIDAADLAGDEPDADEHKIDAENGRAIPDDDMNDGKEDDDAAEAWEMSDWTVSVLFKSAGKDFEALVNDDGKIQYVYETIPAEKAPRQIIDAAREAVKDGDVIFCQKCSDESKEAAVHTYVVVVGAKDVELDLEGKVLKVKDAPADAEEDDEGGDDMKLRI